MPKPRRIIVPDHFYHLYNRFVGGYNLFQNKEIIDIFFKIFNKTAKKYGVCVYILYCMSNHFHALIKLTSENLSEFIQRYSTRFCRLVNEKLERRGHVFQTRHKTQLVQTDQYFSAVVKYIFRNACRAGIVTRVEDYQFSNLKDIIETYPKDPKYKELLELVLQKPITRASGQEFIAWLNEEEDISQIKEIKNQFLTELNKKEEILEKVDRRKKKCETAISHRKSELASSTDINEKIREIVVKYFRRNKNHTWRTDKTASLHCIWYILAEEFCIKLKQICEWYGIYRHQTVVSAIARIKTTENKKKHIKNLKKHIKIVKNH